MPHDLPTDAPEGWLARLPDHVVQLGAAARTVVVCLRAYCELSSKHPKVATLATVHLASPSKALNAVAC